jgi:hypothetical protein
VKAPVILFLLITVGIAFADFLPSISEPVDISSVTDKYAGSPNETIPIYAKKILEEAPTGVVAAVGSERALLDMLLAPNATHLLVLDIDPAVTFFHQVNTALLKLSTSQADYLKLRFNATADDWIRRAKKSASLDLLSLKVLTDAKSHAWWTRQVRSDRDNWKFFNHEFGYHFKDVNYLKQDEQGIKQYSRLKNLADNNKIQAKTLDLSDKQGVARVIQAMKDHRPPLNLSVLDVSNAWEKGYISKDDQLTETRTLINQFEDVITSQQSRFLATRGVQMKVGDELRGEFGYVGASFDRLAKDSADLTKFLKYLQDVQAKKVPAIGAFSTFNPHVVTPSSQVPETEEGHR